MAPAVDQQARALGDWTRDRIDGECDHAYELYAEELRTHHRRWPSSPTAARRDVFPAGFEWIGEILPRDAWHRAWWAAKSSQTLALTLLAASTRADPALSWLPCAQLLGERPLGLFEVELAENVLNERPRQTQLDFLAVGREGVIAVEAKFSERGFGACSCEGRASGVCSERVLDRPYWEVAKRELGLAELDHQCPLSVAYQAVRNIAAAQAIATSERDAAFVLTYDDRNPYFTGAGSWPGWVAILNDLSQHAQTFAALSWQELLGRVPLNAALLDWASEKHGLEPKAPR